MKVAEWLALVHPPGASAYGRSVILSASTSFGKSLIVDAPMATGRFRNVVIVVSAIALIDETQRRRSGWRARSGSGRSTITGCSPGAATAPAT